MPGDRMTPATALGAAAAAGLLSACMGDPLPPPSATFAPSAYPAWTSGDAETVLFPGDRIRIAFRTAPELDGEHLIGPDGRISPPLVGPLTAGGRSARTLAAELSRAYAAELIDPGVTVAAVEYASQSIFVGGEVRTPGVYPLPGAIDPLQAVLLAGGWTETGRPTRVIVFRRDAAGRVASRVVDVRGGLADPTLHDVGPLQRFDIVYVTRKAIADENLFIRQYIRDALPVSFGLYYDVSRF